MIYSNDESAIKLHVDDAGFVWHVSGIDKPQNSGKLVDTFLYSSPVLRVSSNVRVLGLSQNAELITNMYLRKRQRELGSILVAGPNICESGLELRDPYIVLMRMRESFLTSACGGWHTMTDADYATYALVAKARQTAHWFDTPARAFYTAHPAFPALQFIPNISNQDAATLLATIVDPRWYVDRRIPDRASKLELYLGLTPKIQRRISNDKKLICRGRDLRCAIVLNCWKTQHPGAVDYNLPQNFIWRVWKAAGGGAKGDLRASQAFVRYLRLNWLDALILRAGPRDRIFSSNNFFKTSEERDAYSTHMSAM
jgi:hypothetical protein